MVELLLGYGARREARERRGMTALDQARAMGADDTAAQLAG